MKSFFLVLLLALLFLGAIAEAAVPRAVDVKVRARMLGDSGDLCAQRIGTREHGSRL